MMYSLVLYLSLLYTLFTIHLLLGMAPSPHSATVDLSICLVDNSDRITVNN